MDSLIIQRAAMIFSDVKAILGNAAREYSHNLGWQVG